MPNKKSYSFEYLLHNYFLNNHYVNTSCYYEYIF